MKALFLLIVLLAACGPTTLPVASDRPPAAPMPGIGSITINPQPLPPPPPGVPLGGQCVPDLGQWLPEGARCQAGLTCRVLGTHIGVCRPTGQLPAGAFSSDEDECGQNMILVSNQVGQTYCALLCYPPAGQVRCKNNACLPFNSEELGICR